MSQRPSYRDRRRDRRKSKYSPTPSNASRRRPVWPVAIVAIALLGAAALGIFVLNPTLAGPGASSTATATPSSAAAVSGSSSSPAAPAGSSASPTLGTAWPADPPGLTTRLAAAGLPALSAEGTALHIHQHLDIYVNGSPVAVPAGIGIDEAAGSISPIHTHDDTGVIHVESPTVQTFTLGQFFDVWGVRLSATCLGGYCAAGDQQLSVYVNGTKVTGDPRAVTLESHQEILVAFGTAAQLPSPIPSSFDFPAGL